VDEHAAVTRLRREPVLNGEPIVGELVVGQQMPARRSKTHEHPIPHDKRLFTIRVLIEFRHVHMPAGEVGPVEKRSFLRGAAFGGCDE
jgi:hypothetical protein